jgi:hypothetical protein
MKNVSRRILLTILSGCLLASFVSCGGKHNGKAKGEEERTIELDGVLSSRGSSPLPALLLEGQEGRQYVVRSATLYDELQRLTGMAVSVECVQAPETYLDLPVIIVNRYTMLPLSSGELPVVGIIEIKKGTCLLVNDTGTQIEVIGEFKNVIKEFAGAKVWVIGSDKIEQGKERVIEATGYGIIKPVE